MNPSAHLRVRRATFPQFHNYHRRMSPTHGIRDDSAHDYDAVLYLSFGGPDSHDDVMPFLEKVTQGRGVPRHRLEEVAEHYYRCGGASPINEQNRQAIEALDHLLADEGPDLPVYWGNRNWHPFVEDTMAKMAADGVRRALTFCTSAFSSYSACRQYLEDIERARRHVGDSAPSVDKIRHFYNHPGFIEPQADAVQQALSTFDDVESMATRLVFTAHSIPTAMSEASSYVEQLQESCRLVSERCTPVSGWDLVYQSRSGSPAVPWLEPDVSDHLEEVASLGLKNVVVVPIGFVSDHLEVKYDLDIEAAERADELGLGFARASTVGTHPSYIRMIRDLILERIEGHGNRPALGERGPSHDVCAVDCCVFDARR